MIQGTPKTGALQFQRMITVVIRVSLTDTTLVAKTYPAKKPACTAGAPELWPRRFLLCRLTLSRAANED